MDLIKKLCKKLSSHHIIAALGLVVLVIAISHYSKKKTFTYDGMDDAPVSEVPESNHAVGNVMAANPAGENEVFHSVTGMETSNQNNLNQQVSADSTKPEDLLPQDNNSDWSRLNPSSSGDLSQVNLLKAGYHSGIDTVGGSLRNANLQIRSEPPNPTNNVSPWMNTTITPDLERRPLE